MILKYVQGCIADSLTVDDVEEINLTSSEREEVMNKMCNFLRNKTDDCNEIMQYIISMYGKWHSDGKRCPHCGDTIDTYILEL